MTCAVDIGSDALLLHGLRITGPITDCRTTSNDASQTVQLGLVLPGLQYSACPLPTGL